MPENSENKNIYLFFCPSDTYKHMYADYQDDLAKQNILFSEFKKLIKNEVENKFNITLKFIDKERTLADELHYEAKGYLFPEDIDNFIFDIKFDMLIQSEKNCKNKNLI